MISLRSKVAVKILNYFFINPEARHYINELAGILGLDPKNTDTKLKELERAGLLKSEFSGKQRYFYLSKEFPLLEEYKKIVLKTAGIESELKKILSKIPKIKEAYLFGSYAKGKMDEMSDIDLLVIGDHSVLALQKEINKAQKEMGREINAISFSEKEFEQKKDKNSPFVKKIFSEKHIKLI